MWLIPLNGCIIRERRGGGLELDRKNIQVATIMAIASTTPLWQLKRGLYF
jgi:hypothetical protein